MKKIFNIVLIILWVLLVGAVVLPLIPNLEPITELLESIRPYLLIGLIVLTLVIIGLIVFTKYKSEISDNERFIKYESNKKVLTKKERNSLLADLQLAEFTLNGDKEETGEELFRKKMLRENLVVTTLTPKQEKKLQREQLKADIKAAKQKEKKTVLINTEERNNLVAIKNRKRSWLVWLLLIVTFGIYYFGYYMLLGGFAVPYMSSEDLVTILTYLQLVAPVLGLVLLIVFIVKRKNVLPAFSIPSIITLLLQRVTVFLIQDDFGVGFDNVYYCLFNIGFVLALVMLIIFTIHYLKPKYIYISEEEDKARKEKLEQARLAKEAKEKEKQEKLAKEAAEKEEQKRLAKEAAEKAKQEKLEKEAAEKAEKERLAKEAEEKKEQERLAKEAAEKAEQERLAKEAAEKAEQERLAKEKAEQERLAREAALNAEIERLAKEAAEKARLEEEKKAQEVVEEVAPQVELIKLSPTKSTKVKLWEGLEVNVSSGWGPYIGKEEKKQYFKDMMDFIKFTYETNSVYPEKENLFKCFEYTDFVNTKVVIVGKLPFYRKDQADGLAYSTKVGSSMNQTTKVIVQEAVNDVGIKNSSSGSFVNWAKQGVLLLNSIMTAPADRPASHAECGWVEFTDGIIELLNKDARPKVFILWGEYAREKVGLITNPNHLVLEAPNPSPLSAANGFYGSKPFSKTNDFLTKNGYEPIDWEL